MLALRPATAADAHAIAAILEPEISDGTAHFGTTPPTAESIARQMLDAPAHPYLVAEREGAVVGFARSSPWKEREAYDWTAEIGIYLARGSHGRGIGRLLLQALLDALEEAGFRTLLAGIALPNPASVRLFEAKGFRPAGVLEQVGHKHGGWRDVGYWSLLLGDGPPPARPSAPPRTVPLVQVDAFATRAFEGNPAAVVRLPHWLPDPTLAAIARENNLSETAFVVHEPRGWHLRWFTPEVEVDLCGHATLAAGFALLGDDGGDAITFHSRSGPLVVRRAGSELAMDLPAHPPGAAGISPEISAALGIEPIEGWAIKALHHADYWLALFPDAETVARIRPDMGRLTALRSNVICTAPGTGELDFVSRFFAPGSGVPEDPVTGSAHATLTPFWVDRLGRNPLQARQISARGGSMRCELAGDRVILTASCVEVIRGRLTLPEPNP